MGWELRAGLDAARGSFPRLPRRRRPGRDAATRSGSTSACRRPGADVVKGRRDVREDGSVRTLTSLGLQRSSSASFSARRPLVGHQRPAEGHPPAPPTKRLDLRTDDWFTDAEIVLKASAPGLGIVEVPVRFLPRQTASSLVGPGTVWEFLDNMARWRLGRHDALTALSVRRSPRAVARERR